MINTKMYANRVTRDFLVDLKDTIISENNISMEIELTVIQEEIDKLDESFKEYIQDINLYSYIDEYYIVNYPDDITSGMSINHVTFNDLYSYLKSDLDIYDCIGIEDSFIRECLFMQLSKILKVNYDSIYNLWIK